MFFTFCDIKHYWYTSIFSFTVKWIRSIQTSREQELVGTISCTGTTRVRIDHKLHCSFFHTTGTGSAMKSGEKNYTQFRFVFVFCFFVCYVFFVRMGSSKKELNLSRRAPMEVYFHESLTWKRNQTLHAVFVLFLLADPNLVALHPKQQQLQLTQLNGTPNFASSAIGTTYYCAYCRRFFKQTNRKNGTALLPCTRMLRHVLSLLFSSSHFLKHAKYTNTPTIHTQETKKRNDVFCNNLCFSSTSSLGNVFPSRRHPADAVAAVVPYQEHTRGCDEGAVSEVFNHSQIRKWSDETRSGEPPESFEHD